MFCSANTNKYIQTHSNLPLDISYKEISSNTEREQALSYITWGLIWDLKTKDNKEIPVLY